jgi:putative ABC transport system substrate-binding protein
MVAFGYPAALAIKQGTTLPAVISGAGDPVGTGLIDNLAHPGGHLTGISDVSAGHRQLGAGLGGAGWDG